MYAISNAITVYTTSFFLLCAAFFLAPSVANANEYWSVLDKRFIPPESVPNAVKEMLGHNVSRPSGSTITSVPSAPTISKNASGGLSASTNQILKTLDQPSNFSATSNYSVASAKNALKSCVRSPACAGRALGAGAIIYEGINAWKDVYDLLQDPVTNNITMPHPDGVVPDAPDYPNPEVTHTAESRIVSADSPCPADIGGYAVMFCEPYNDRNQRAIVCGVGWGGSLKLVGIDRSTYRCQYAGGSPWQPEVPRVPASPEQLDDLIDEGYEPAVSDAPIVLLSGDPDTFTLGTPASAELPSTTTTSTDSQGKTTTTVKNSVITYNILNNNSSSPSIESTITETSNTYDDTANLVGSMTSTTNNNAVVPDPLSPSSGASADIELPPFCTYASIVCDWIGWTKEGIEGEEPDLINLISEFEPDENQYNSGIGSGSCPAPMSLNLGIINRTVEVSYQPFCDFLDMIRPLVIAGAWLLSAFMYVGVLRRG